MLDIFSTRELAIGIWLIIFLIIAILLVGFKSILPVLKAFLDWKIQATLWTMIIYIGIIILLLQKINIWNFSLLKDTIIWTVTSATVLLFNLNKAKEIKYFLPLVLENLKVSIVLEFIFNFYTFSFATELFFIPIMTFLVMLKTFAEHSSKTNTDHIKVFNCLSKLNAYIGIILFMYVTYETYYFYRDLQTPLNAISLILPFILTIALLPFLYFTALLINYEQVFIRIKFFHLKDRKKKKLKKLILIYANINLNKLNKITFNLFEIGNKKKMRKAIKKSIS